MLPFLLVILNTGAPDVVSISAFLLDKGSLGLFLIALIYTVRYLAKLSNKQMAEVSATHRKMLEKYKEEIATLRADRDAAVELREGTVSKFIEHLECSETKLLEIVKENSMAFNSISESNENVAEAVKLLTVSIKDRNTTTENFNQKIEWVVDKLDR